MSGKHVPAGGSLVCTRHDLIRVPRPVPTAKHRLAGLWKGFYGRHGVQVVQVVYDFTGSSARIIACKVCVKHLSGLGSFWNLLDMLQWCTYGRDLGDIGSTVNISCMRGGR